MRVIVAFDGSDGAMAALRAAARVMGESDGELIALRVLNPLTDAEHVLADTGSEAIARVVTSEQRHLQAELAGVDELSGLHVTLLVETLVHGEDVPDHLARAADERGADVIAIGSTRAVGVKGLLLGSVTQHLLRVSVCPVLVVRPAPTSTRQRSASDPGPSTTP